MINRVVLVGRITKDPELRKTSSGISVVQFTLAVNRPKNKDGEQEADFINCEAWRHSADFMTNYVKKGALLGIEGRITTSKYADKNGHVLYQTKVTCESVQILNQKQQNAQNEATDIMEASVDIQSDDLPF